VESWFQYPAWVDKFSLYQRFQTGSVAYPAPLFKVFWDYPPTYDCKWQDNVKMGKRMQAGFICLRLGLAPRFF